MDGGHGTARSRDAVAALESALRQAVRDAPHTEACQFAAGAGFDTCSCWRDDAIRALADAPDPLAEAREAVCEAQTSTHDLAPLSFGDGRPTVRVLMTIAGWQAVRRALGTEVDGE